MRQYKEERPYSVTSTVCLHCLCGIAVVAGVKMVPALAGLNIITHPVETLRISLVRFVANLLSIAIDTRQDFRSGCVFRLCIGNHVVIDLFRDNIVLYCTQRK
jgi:hypothetical protein